MSSTTVSTTSGLLRVEVERRGSDRWSARLVDPPAAYRTAAAAVGCTRDEALSALQAAVRTVGIERLPPASPASWVLCP